MTKFTDKQKAFINHYLKCLNATEAAKRAGYKGNYDTLRSVGSENLAKPNVRAAIDKRLEKQAMSADEVIRRLSDIAGGNLTDYIWRDGELDLEALKEDGRGHLLKKYKKTRKIITQKDGGQIEIESTESELYGADYALDKLMRYYGKYNDSMTIKDPWKDDIVQALIDGRLKPEDVKLFYADSPDLVAEFFKRANVSA